MPRNPSTGVYTLPPGTGGTPNQPISSTMFNTYVGDAAQDANTARPISAGGTSATNATQARTNLGLAIGTDVQAYDALLQSIAGLTTSANQMIYLTGTDTAAVTSITTYGRSLIDDADAAAARTTLGLGTIATQAASAVAITGGSVTGITDLAIADGGTGASTAAAARTNLGLGTAATVNTGTSGATIPLLNGVNTWAAAQTFTSNLTVQNTTPAMTLYDTTTSAYNGRILVDANNMYLQGSSDNVTYANKIQFELDTGNVYFNGTTLVFNGTSVPVAAGGTGATTAATARTNLGLAIGTNVQAYDAALQAISGLATTDGGFIVGTGATFAIETGATARTSLGLGSLATLSSINNANWSGTDLAIANGGTGASDAPTARANLGLGGIATLDQADLFGTWQIVARTGGTTYQNTTGKWLPLNFSIANNGIAVSISDTTTFGSLQFGGNSYHTFALVPPGWYYKFSTNGTIMEAR